MTYAETYATLPIARARDDAHAAEIFAAVAARWQFIHDLKASDGPISATDPRLALPFLADERCSLCDGWFTRGWASHLTSCRVFAHGGPPSDWLAIF